MARSITVIVRTIEATPHTAGVEVNTDSQTWVKSEPGSANNVFKTKQGPYRMVGTTFELARAGGGLRVGKFLAFDAATVSEGQKGQGLSDDIGLAIEWTVDKIAHL